MSEVKNMSAHLFKPVYEWLGINLNKLGCVMLDVKDDKALQFNALQLENPPEILYYAKNKERFWIDGWVANKNPHITLLYGLLQLAKHYESHINKVMEGWVMSPLEIEDIGFFPSPYPDEDYNCLVAHIKVTSSLLEGHARLSFLPHVNTFTTYKPHMTLGYIKNDPYWRDKIISQLKGKLIGKKLDCETKLNLGDAK